MTHRRAVGLQLKFKAAKAGAAFKHSVQLGVRGQSAKTCAFDQERLARLRKQIPLCLVTPERLVAVPVIFTPALPFVTFWMMAVPPKQATFATTSSR